MARNQLQASMEAIRSLWGPLTSGLVDGCRRQLESLVKAQDGYRTTLLLEDLLADDVLLADELNAKPLVIEHGAPLRLIAPRHYGYKSLKHLSMLEFWAPAPVVKHGPLALLDHPRARVALEERGQWSPGWILRRLYRPLIPGTVKAFRVGMLKYRQSLVGGRDA